MADNADRFTQNDGQVFGIKLGRSAFFAADHAGEIAEMVGSQRHVGGAGFADRFAIVQGFLQGKQFGIFVDHIGDFVQNGCAFGSRGFAPCFERFLRSGYSSIDIGIGCVCELGQLIAISRVVRG